MPSPSAKPQGRQRVESRGYEKRDANAKWIFGIVLFLLLAGIGIHLIVARMTTGLQRTPAPTDAWSGASAHQRQESSVARGSFPRLQISPSEDLKEFQTREDLELNTYGWINKTAGVARIPIERAMDLLLKRGLPTSNGTNGIKLGPSSYELQQQRPGTAEKEVGK